MENESRLMEHNRTQILTIICLLIQLVNRLTLNDFDNEINPLTWFNYNFSGF